MAQDALHVRGLAKSFDKPAVRRVDLSIPPGEFYGLLGPNGAGKTTTLKMIVGLLAPDAGTIDVYGIDARANPLAAKQLIAWLPDEPMLYDKLTPLEYLEFVAGLWRIDARTAEHRAQELLECLDLWEHRDVRCEGFSRGMRQKAALAAALIHDPKLLVLDEPLTGLDAAIGTISRRTERLVSAYLDKLGTKRLPDAILFRNRSGNPYRDDTLGDDFAAVRELVFPGDARRLMDMRRSGVVEAIAGDVGPLGLSAKLANSIERSNTLHKTYAPLDIEAVRKADAARLKGRKRIRAGERKRGKSINSTA
jgi:ABC-type Na+ transport system ATPase subunit NatA